MVRRALLQGVGGLSKSLGTWRSYCVWAGWCGVGEAARKKVTDKAIGRDRTEGPGKDPLSAEDVNSRPTAG